jgi:predicted TIM-barrel fold metal-dependent hydrolase
LDSEGRPVIDASVHAFFASDRDLRDHLREPFKSRGYPDVDVAWFAPPDGVRYAPGTQTDSVVEQQAFGQPVTTMPGHPGSDPELVGRQLFEERGVDIAVLHPMSNAGILPDWHLGTAIFAAYNQMLVERWLDSGTYADRFRGTIRVNPNDIDGAVREINRYKDHPRVVQIGLPMQTQHPYGRPYFRPLWRAAVEAGLPVAVHIEMGVGITHPPTPSGITRTFSHLAAYQPMTFVWHLLNMIAEGVFEEFPELKIVWADGAADMLTPFIWRMDSFGRPHLEQTPWAPKIPSAYLADHVYFVHGALDGPGADADFADDWLRMTGKEDHSMFGSSYPDWQMHSPDDLPRAWTPEQREKVLWRTAARLYGIEAPLSAPAPIPVPASA